MNLTSKPEAECSLRWKNKGDLVCVVYIFNELLRELTYFTVRLKWPKVYTLKTTVTDWLLLQPVILFNFLKSQLIGYSHPFYVLYFFYLFFYHLIVYNIADNSLSSICTLLTKIRKLPHLIRINHSVSK